MPFLLDKSTINTLHYHWHEHASLARSGLPALSLTGMVTL